MDQRKRWVVLSLACTAMVGLTTGCNESRQPPPPSSATPTASAPAENVVEQTALARSVYENYLAATGQLAESEPYDFRVLEPWASTEVATVDAARLEELAASGIFVRGAPTVATFDYDSSRGDVLEALTCVDLTSQRYVDRQGIDITPADQPNLIALRVTFERPGAGRSYLLVEQRGAASELTCG